MTKKLIITITDKKEFSVASTSSEEVDEFKLLVGMQKRLKGRTLRNTRSTK